jgi:hypothetical protein
MRANLSALGTLQKGDDPKALAIVTEAHIEATGLLRDGGGLRETATNSGLTREVVVSARDA